MPYSVLVCVACSTCNFYGDRAVGNADQLVAAQYVMGCTELARIRTQLAQLRDREAELVKILRDRGPGIYFDEGATAMVAPQERRTVDIEGLRSKYTREVEEFTGSNTILIVKILRTS